MSHLYSKRHGIDAPYTISTTDGPRQVYGYCYKGLLIHPSIFFSNTYTITHLGSGYAIGSTRTLGQARRAVRALLATGIDSFLPGPSYARALWPTLKALRAAGVLRLASTAPRGDSQ